MRFFKRGRSKEGAATPGKDQLVKVIAAVILKIQKGFARFMSRATKNIPAAILKWALLVFALTGSALSIHFITLALSKKKKETLKIDRLRVPKYYDQDGTPFSKPGFDIPLEQHEEMKQFQEYMDSIRNSKTGSLLYDSFLLNHPGLRDSIRMLEEMYQNQR